MSSPLRCSALLLSAALTLGAQSPYGAPPSNVGLEQMHGAVGVVFPQGDTQNLLDAGFTVAFGGIYWVAPHVGVHAELSYDHINPAPGVGPGAGAGQIYAFTAGAAWKLHSGRTGFYLVTSGGIHNIRMATVPDTLPVEPGTFTMTTTTRGGATGILGFETPLGSGGTFFIEARYQRIFTRGQALDLIPLMVGTRF